MPCFQSFSIGQSHLFLAPCFFLSIAIQRSASSYPFFPSLPQFFRFRLIVKLFFFLSPLYLPFPTLFHFPSTTISFLSFFFDRSFLPPLQSLVKGFYPPHLLFRATFIYLPSLHFPHTFEKRGRNSPEQIFNPLYLSRKNSRLSA